MINLSKAQAISDPKLYIGIEKNRLPYMHEDGHGIPQGILIDKTRHVCKSMGQQCEFISHTWYELLEELKAYHLDMIAIVDNLFIPDIDKLATSKPICRTQPIFVQKANQAKRTHIDDFRKTTIGVREGSTLHFYLLEHYSEYAAIKPYSLLENALFDLDFERIDTLLTNQAFFWGRIAETPLSNWSYGDEGKPISKHQDDESSNNSDKLFFYDANQVTWDSKDKPTNESPENESNGDSEKPTLPTINVYLATHEDNRSLLSQFNQALKRTGSPDTLCSSLVEQWTLQPMDTKEQPASSLTIESPEKNLD